MASEFVPLARLSADAALSCDETGAAVGLRLGQPAECNETGAAASLRLGQQRANSQRAAQGLQGPVVRSGRAPPRASGASRLAATLRGAERWAYLE